MAETAAVELLLVWQEGDEPGQVEFVVTRVVAGELLASLTEQGVTADVVDRGVRSTGADLLSTVVAAAGNPAAWAAIGIAVKAFLDRHKGKRIRVDEHGLAETVNYSARDIERIVGALAERGTLAHQAAEPGRTADLDNTAQDRGACTG